MKAMAKGIDLDRLYQALADRTRLRLLNLMRDGEVCVCYFVEVLKASQPKISRHLAYLRRANLVTARREGKWIHYRIAEPGDEHAAAILRETLAWASGQPDMVADRARMVAVCCSPRMPVALRMAPRPEVAATLSR